MTAIFSPQPPVTDDAGAVTLGFQSAPNVLYDRTMVGATTYTIEPTGTTGGETMAITLRGAFDYTFTSSVAINWAGGVAPAPECSASVFDRIKFEVLQDGSLLGLKQAMAAGVPIAAPAHYLNISESNAYASAPATAANDGSDSFLSIREWIKLTSAYAPGVFAPFLGLWSPPNANSYNSEYIFGLTPSGQIQFDYFDSERNFYAFNSTDAISSELANVAGLWLRVDCNAGSTTVNGVPPGALIFYTSPGGPNPQWTQLGDQVTGQQTGFIHPGPSAVPFFFGAPAQTGWNTNTGYVYEAVIENSTTVLANPNFQAQPTTAIGGSFADTAATPNTITLTTANIV